MYNPFSLENKYILITGASSGIGRAIAIECAKMGASLLVTGRDEKRLKDTFSLLDNIEKHNMICADLSNLDEIDKLVSCIPVKLDGLVQCAGLAVPKPMQFISSEDIQHIMDINYKAPVLLSQKIVKKKIINKYASIVFISSISGVFISSVGASLYSGSKGALNGFMKGMAIELASKSIRVNCITPGMIDTNIYEDGIITREQLEEDSKKYPLGRYGKPIEVAHGAVYLLSKASSWVTGTNLVIDGGYTLL